MWLGGLWQGFASLSWFETQTRTLLNAAVGPNTCPALEGLEAQPQPSLQPSAKGLDNHLSPSRGPQPAPSPISRQDPGCEHALLVIYQSNTFHRHLPHRRVRSGTCVCSCCRYNHIGAHAQAHTRVTTSSLASLSITKYTLTFFWVVS